MHAYVHCDHTMARGRRSRCTSKYALVARKASWYVRIISSGWFIVLCRCPSGSGRRVYLLGVGRSHDIVLLSLRVHLCSCASQLLSCYALLLEMHPPTGRSSFSSLGFRSLSFEYSYLLIRFLAGLLCGACAVVNNTCFRLHSHFHSKWPYRLTRGIALCVALKLCIIFVK